MPNAHSTASRGRADHRPRTPALATSHSGYSPGIQQDPAEPPVNRTMGSHGIAPTQKHTQHKTEHLRYSMCTKPTPGLQTDHDRLRDRMVPVCIGFKSVESIGRRAAATPLCCHVEVQRARLATPSHSGDLARRGVPTGDREVSPGVGQAAGKALGWLKRGLTQPTAHQFHCATAHGKRDRAPAAGPAAIVPSIPLFLLARAPFPSFALGGGAPRPRRAPAHGRAGRQARRLRGKGWWAEGRRGVTVPPTAPATVALRRAGPRRGRVAEHRHAKVVAFVRIRSLFHGHDEQKGVAQGRRRHRLRRACGRPPFVDSPASFCGAWDVFLSFIHFPGRRRKTCSEPLTLGSQKWLNTFPVQKRRPSRKRVRPGIFPYSKCHGIPS
eukprot:gene13888-biopygen3584